jgi:putative heme-binding domain-containing protein
MREAIMRRVARFVGLPVGLVRAAVPPILVLALAAAVLAQSRSRESGRKPTTRPANPPASKPAARPPKSNEAMPSDAIEALAPSSSSAPVSKGTAAAADASGRKLQAPPNFVVEVLLPHEKTGSLIAMAFDAQGRILASREGGPLLLITDANGDGRHDTVAPYCDLVKNIQGILPHDEAIFVTGEGPEGLGLYRLQDKNNAGKIDEAQRLIAFTCKVLEHGPHGLALGPDGRIYVACGNHTQLVEPAAQSSPYRGYYDDDLLLPRYEDPNGHAVGVKAPGGFIFRMDVDGKTVELVAGGMRNAYDLAFDAAGELFTHDADMELDIGAPWYRPTRVLHVVPGAEFGWRSGWAKWPEYYLDSLPPVVDTGTGSPAGMTFYQHVMFPLGYQNALFVCDWAKGQVVCIRTKRVGSSFRGQSEVFISGDPLNATDIAVGPDGGLYVCTGGRGTQGGILRVTWNGNVPAEVRDPGTGIKAALRQPHPTSPWGRKRIEELRQQIGGDWSARLTAIAQTVQMTPADRTKALSLLSAHGPPPSKALLMQLSRDGSAEVRAKTADLLALHGDPTTAVALAGLSMDRDPSVRRHALEAMARVGQPADLVWLFATLTSPDPHLAWSARRALETLPKETWRDAVLKSRDLRVFIQGSVAIMTAHPDHYAALSIVRRSQQVMQGFVSDRDFVDLLRVQQLAVLRGKLTAEETKALAAQLSEEFPSRNDAINRELARLLAHFQAPAAKARLIEQLAADVPGVEKVHLALHLTRMKIDWTSDEKLALLRYLETARSQPGGTSLGRYIERAALEFGPQLSEADREKVLKDALKWPTAATAVLAQLPERPGKETVSTLIELDQNTTAATSDAVARMKIAIVAVLARSGEEEAMAHLREVFQNEPERRVTAAMGLAQAPDGENWPLLIQALPLLDGVAAQEVLRRLGEVERQPLDAEAYRQVILRGLRLKQDGAPLAIKLLEKWSGETLSDADDAWDDALGKWQAWFKRKHPNAPDPALPVDHDGNKWNFDELLTYLSGPEAGKASALRGERHYNSAQCAKCHRYGDRGEAIGPDLSSVARRFAKKEILEAILFPSHVVSDQYASKRLLLADGRSLSGLVAEQGNQVILVTSTGERIAIDKDQIDEMKPSNVSVMPDGLLNDLSSEQIAELFAYLTQPAAVAKRPTPGPTTK